MPGKMRILIIYPGHSHSTYDVARGYENALSVLGHEVQVHNYHNQLAFFSEAIRHWMRLNPDFKLENPNDAIRILSSESVAIQAIDHVPDVVLIVCGIALHRRAYNLLHSLGLPLVLLATESPYLDETQAQIVEQGHISLTFANDKSSVLPLREMTGKPVEYLPHSLDHLLHYNQDVGEEYKSDLFFLGTMWPERRRLLTPLKRWAGRWRPGWTVRIDGPTPMARGQSSRLIDNDELARFYNGTRVALNHHRTIIKTDGEGKEVHVGQAYSIGPRAYEIAACAAFQLCDGTRPELAEVFGDTVATYADAADLRRKVDYYMAHDDEREDMAWAACERAQACSFEDRAKNILLPCIEEVL
jgi:spore maturation protein CgeB